MEFKELLAAQLTDVFRVGFMVALVLTTFKRQEFTGMIIPLSLGIIFVAILIPNTLQLDNQIPKSTLVMTGIVANAIIVAVLLAARAVWMRFGTGRAGE